MDDDEEQALVSITGVFVSVGRFNIEVTSFHPYCILYM
jgi:hypothetical protein